VHGNHPANHWFDLLVLAEEGNFLVGEPKLPQCAHS
jgi:hypothetical protein